jgi:hypothetical protein
VLPEAVGVTMIAFGGYGNYMTTSTSLRAQICPLACCLFLGHASGLLATELVLEKVPPLTVEQAPAYPQNLARYYLGAKVEAAPQSQPIAALQLSSKSEDTNTAEAALLCDDPTVGYALPSGSTTLLVSFAKIENIDSISFLNRGAKGDVKIAISSAKLPAESPQWHDVSQQELTSDAVKAKVGPSEAKYVRLTFNVTEPGRIAGFGVYCTATVSDFTMARPRKLNVQEKPDNFALISYSSTDLHARARALYVSSGDDLTQANNMIDDQPATSFTFASTDGAPTAIIDVGRHAALRRISALYSSRPGSIDFFVLQSLPGSRRETTAENAPKTLHFDDSTVADLKPVGSVVDDGSGRATIDFRETTGRYIMLKWTPKERQDTPFSVAEVATFGVNQPTSLMAANVAGPTREGIASEGKAVEERFKELGAGKEMPEEGPPAEGPPPNLPAPPPFTFVPEIVPVSPD